MILQVVKKNSNFPIGTMFHFKEGANVFYSIERNEDVGDDYEMIKESYYQFSPSFYELNKELFNQVKLEDRNEKNKNISGEENSETETENISGNNSDETGNCDNCPLQEEETLLRDKVEERYSQSAERRNSVQEERYPESGPEREREENKRKNQRIARLAEIDDLLFELKQIRKELDDE